MLAPKFSFKTGALVILVILGFASISWLFEAYNPVGSQNRALMWIAISSIFLIVAIFFFLPKHLKSYKPSINSVFISYALVLFTYSAFLYVNFEFDDSPIVRQRLPMREKFASQFKGESYLVTFFLPRSPIIEVAGFESTEVPFAAFKRADASDTYVNLELKAGLLGIPWIQSSWLEFPKERR
ncbi:MAG: hypothetical protein V4692_12890 [Bdellovibrionota bacterium]